VDPVFFDPESYGSVDLLGAHYAYAVQVYCDFSGYSDIAIGAAALLGYQFKKNFDRPLAATSLVMLWQRWHISLSTWLRDYLYRALRGPKRDKGWRMYKNVFLTMLLGGLWHGAAWTFVIWGALHGAVLVLERFVKGAYHDHVKRNEKPDAPQPSPAATALKGFASYWLGWLFTFHVFSIAAIFFRSPDMETVYAYFRQMLAWTGELELMTPFMLLLVGGAVAVQFLPGNVFERTAERFQNARMVTIGAVLAISLLLMEAIGPEGVAPFIYFQF
jgi:D-alanyl-lipoteichoic acid acyltransferase DltB (MBOAT superfamily)